MREQNLGYTHATHSFIKKLYRRSTNYEGSIGGHYCDKLLIFYGNNDIELLLLPNTNSLSHNLVTGTADNFSSKVDNW